MNADLAVFFTVLFQIDLGFEFELLIWSERKEAEEPDRNLEQRSRGHSFKEM